MGKIVKSGPIGWPRKVIVADDNAAQQRAIRDFVEKSCGHRALPFKDWRAALDALKSARGDRLILNFYMGQSQNEGKALLQALQSGGQDIPTIIVAPHKDGSVRSWCAGFRFVKGYLDSTDLFADFHQVQEILSRAPSLDGDIQSKKNKPKAENRQPIIFVIHGDHRSRRRVTGILQSLNVQAVYLEGDTVKGKVAVEALENYARNSDYAVCIFSGDDVGYQKGNEVEKELRARQNVVFEAGFFMAALTRPRIMILSEEGVKLPRDMAGILHVPLSLTDNKLRERFVQTFTELNLPIKLSFEND